MGVTVWAWPHRQWRCGRGCAGVAVRGVAVWAWLCVRGRAGSDGVGVAVQAVAVWAWRCGRGRGAVVSLAWGASELLLFIPGSVLFTSPAPAVPVFFFYNQY